MRCCRRKKNVAKPAKHYGNDKGKGKYGKPNNQNRVKSASRIISPRKLNDGDGGSLSYDEDEFIPPPPSGPPPVGLQVEINAEGRLHDAEFALPGQTSSGGLYTTSNGPIHANVNDDSHDMDDVDLIDDNNNNNNDDDDDDIDYIDDDTPMKAYDVSHIVIPQMAIDDDQ